MNAKVLRIVTDILLKHEVDIFPKRVQKLADVVTKLSAEQIYTLRLEFCIHGGGDQDRYGKARGREGRAVRIGIEPHGKSQRQIWAVWD